MNHIIVKLWDFWKGFHASVNVKYSFQVDKITISVSVLMWVGTRILVNERGRSYIYMFRQSWLEYSHDLTNTQR